MPGPGLVDDIEDAVRKVMGLRMAKDARLLTEEEFERMCSDVTLANIPPPSSRPVEQPVAEQEDLERKLIDLFEKLDRLTLQYEELFGEVPSLPGRNGIMKCSRSYCARYGEM